MSGRRHRPLPRRAVLAGLLALAPLPVLAAGKGGGEPEIYAKLTGIVVEFWDAQGLFHTVNMELTVVFPKQASVGKKISDRIALTLSAMPWEEFSKGNPAATIKAVALDVLRRDPATAQATEVLVTKLMMR